MATKPFIYQDPFPLGKEKTEYYLLTKEYVSVEKFGDMEVLKVEPEPRDAALGDQHANAAIEKAGDLLFLGVVGIGAAKLHRAGDGLGQCLALGV